MSVASRSSPANTSHAPEGSKRSSLTDDEGNFLSLLHREQDSTAYQLIKLYKASPVSNFGVSKGKVYPLIRRLTVRGLVEGTRTAARGGAVALLSCTDAGRHALREWVLAIKDTHLSLDDPLRAKVESFDILSFGEQIEWISAAKAGLQDKLEAIGAYRPDSFSAFGSTLHDYEVRLVRARLDWLDRLLVEVVRNSSPRIDSIAQ